MIKWTHGAWTSRPNVGPYHVRHEMNCYMSPTSRDSWYIVERGERIVAGPFPLDAAKVWITTRLYAEGKL